MVRGKIVSMKQEFVSMTRFGSFLLIILGEKKGLSLFDKTFSNQYGQYVCRRLPFLLFADGHITL